MPEPADVRSSFVDALQRADAPVPVAVAQKGGQPAKRRFDVYRNNVAVGMIEALRATYPAIDVLVGAEFFSAAARVYLERHPPRSPLLFRYGERFGDFLDGFPPAAKIPYLGDVARLEWARLEAYHSEDVTPLPIEALGQTIDGRDDADPGRLRFTLHPSLTLIASRWPIVSLWAASTGQGSSDDVDMKTGERALIIRPALTVETHKLPLDTFAFMSALAENASLEQAAAQAIETVDAFDLASHLQGAFAIGAISAITDPSS